MIKNALDGVPWARRGRATLLLWASALVPAAGCDVARAKGDDPAAYQGTVELDEWLLGFEVPGRVAKVDVTEGALVEAGAPIASLDARLALEAKAARERESEAARAEVAVVESGTRREEIRSAQAQVRAARATEDLLATELARERKLLASGASTLEAAEALDGRLARARAEREALEQRQRALEHGARAEEIEAARARAVATEAAVKLEAERVARHAITSPASGLVLDVHAKPGEVVLAGAPVVTLVDAARPYADVFVPQTALGGIDVGDAASLRVDAEPNPFAARVETIGQRTEFTPRYLFSERERTNLVVRVRVRVEDPERRLHAGVPAFVTIDRGGAQ